MIFAFCIFNVISLNLLPPERKESYRWRSLRKTAIFNSIIILSLLIYFCLPFIVINIYLYTKTKDLEQDIYSYEQKEKIKEINSIEKSARSINNTLVSISKINEDQVYWTSALENVVNKVPSGIQVFSLEVTPEGNFSLIGKAQTRDKILELEKNLKQSSNFKDIQFPFENLKKKTDVDFKFTGIFLLDNFKAKKRIKSEAGGRAVSSK